MSLYMVGGDEVLDPKPLPYQDRGPDTVDFSEYLSGT
jgi:hypothetical protein